MTQPQIPQGTAALAGYVKGLTEQVENLAAEASRLRTFGRHNRTFIVVDIILTVGLALLGALSVHASNSADLARQVAAVARADAAKVKASEMAFCQASNRSRAASIAVWQKLFQLSGPPKSAAAAKLDDEFLDFVEQVYKNRNCATLGQPAPSPSALPGGRR